jgi:GDP-L-fucose synthase
VEKDSKIYIAGHKGMVGSAITRCLREDGFLNLVFTPYPEYDLTDQQTVADFFDKKKPEYVYLAAARVGGIMANNIYRAQFIYENLMIQNNIIHQSYVSGVKKLLFLGSSCIYPKDCPQPIKEDFLLTGPLEYTNEPYAIAKIAGIKMCESYNLQYGTNFISVMPTNLYGPNDNFNLETSHVLPALIRKIHLGKCLENNDWEAIRKDLNKYPIEGVDGPKSESDILGKLAKYGIEYDDTKHSAPSTQHPATSILQPTTSNSYPVAITLWGTGNPYREFLYVDDLSEACIYLMNNIDFEDIESRFSAQNSQIKNTHINIGSGKDLTIMALAEMIKKTIGFKGVLKWDNSKPDGTFRKLLDASRMNSLGWKERIGLETGIQKTYKEYTA